MQRGGIILCGGRSFRMGVDKALLAFGGATMLEKVAATVKSVISPQQIVVVAAANQELPLTDLTILRDSIEYQGPLAAIALGIANLPRHVEATFITGCDAPLLSPAVIEFLFDQLGEHDCAVPRDAIRSYPLCAVYKCSILPKLSEFQGRSLHEFIATLKVRAIPCNDLSAVDPELNSFRNINTPDDYAGALAAAGLSTP